MLWQKPAAAKRGAARLRNQETITSPGNEKQKMIAAVGSTDDSRRGSTCQSAKA